MIIEQISHFACETTLLYVDVGYPHQNGISEYPPTTTFR